LASVRVWDGCALCVQPAQTGTVSPDGAGAKRQLHRINSPEVDGEFILKSFVKSLNIVLPKSSFSLPALAVRWSGGWVAFQTLSIKYFVEEST